MYQLPTWIARAALTTAALAISPLAHALVEVPSTGDYFIRPFAQIGANTQDGLDINGATWDAALINEPISGSQASAEVALYDGTVRAYLEVNGANQFGVAAGVLGDQLTLQGGPGTVDFSFDFDGTVFTSAAASAPNLQIGITANLRVFDSSVGATYANFASASLLGSALVAQTMSIPFDNPGAALSASVSESLFGSFSFAGGTQSVDVFASLSIFTATNDNPVNVVLDFANTGTVFADPAPGIIYDSASSVFPGSQPLAPVPEPGTWAMLTVGLLAVGSLARRRGQR